MTTSVALCTYNGEKYIYTQLESIIKQSVHVDEIIICDDGSKDNTRAIIEDFIQTTTIPIKLICNSINLGYTRNFEKAICQCSGDIILLSDQDDVWLPDKVAIILDFFTKNPDKDFVFTNAQLINQSGLASYKTTLFDVLQWTKKNKKLVDKGYSYDILSLSGRVTGATTALRASFIPYCIPFPQTTISAVHDEIIAVIASITNKIGYIDQCLIQYRIHGQQSVGLGWLFKYAPKNWECSYDNLMWHEDLIELYNSELLAKMQFIHKRFWILRSRGCVVKFLHMYISGEYHQFYQFPLSVFLRDIKSIVIRIFEKIRIIPKYRFLLKEEYYSM